jgi:hypothetical protein
MRLFDHLEKLINEHGSAAILREHLALVKAEQAALERKNSNLCTENASLKAVVAQQKIDATKYQMNIDALK